MRFNSLRKALFWSGWLVFWLLMVLAALVVLLFVWTVAPTAFVVAQGVNGAIWFFGHSDYTLAAATAYLIAGTVLLAKRRARRSAANVGKARDSGRSTGD